MSKRRKLGKKKYLIEGLEQRLLLSAYSFEVIASTVQDLQSQPTPTPSILSAPSINDNGTVAFLAGDKPQGSSGQGVGIFAGNSRQDVWNINPSQSHRYNSFAPHVAFSGTVQINNNGLVAARYETDINYGPALYPDDRLETCSANSARNESCSNPDIMRGIPKEVNITDPIHSGQFYEFTSIAPSPSIDVKGDIAYLAPARSDPAAATLNVHLSTDSPSDSQSPRPSLANFGAQIVQPPLIAYDGTVIINNGSAVVAFYDNNNIYSGAKIIADWSNGFSSLGNSPGISDDGNIIVFYGNLTNPTGPTANLSAGPGIFASIRTSPNTRIIIRIADTQQSISAFQPGTRIGVTDMPSGNSGSFTVAFLATDKSSGKEGLYTSFVNVPSYTVSAPTIVIQAGPDVSTLNGLKSSGLTGNISDIKIYDPLNNNGKLAFLVQFGQSQQAIIRAGVANLGIDVSDFQLTVNWQDVANKYGRTFAYIKAVQGNGDEKTTWKNKADEARNYVSVGLYAFGDPDEVNLLKDNVATKVTDPPNQIDTLVRDDAIAEAKKFFTVATMSGVNYLVSSYLQPMLDLDDSIGNEAQGGFAPKVWQTGKEWEAMARWVDDWTAELQNMEAKAGLPLSRPILYMSGFFAKNLAPFLSYNPNYSLWIKIAASDSNEYCDPPFPTPALGNTWSDNDWQSAIQQYNALDNGVTTHVGGSAVPYQPCNPSDSTNPPGDWDALNPQLTLDNIRIAPATSVIFKATSDNDNFTIRLDPTDNSTVQVFQQSAGANPIYTAPLALCPPLKFDAGSLNTTVFVDYSSGDPLATQGILGLFGLLILETRSTGHISFQTKGKNVPGRPGIASAGSGTVSIEGGNVTFASDADGLSVTANNAAAIDFATSQHLSSLTLSDIAKAEITANGFLRMSSLSVSPTAKLDLGNNGIILDSSAATRSADLATVAGLIGNARTGGMWTGSGITSTAAATRADKATGLAIALNDKGDGTPLNTTFDGQPVDTNSILVKYTYNGDSDLNGKVDADDYFLIDKGFANKSSGYQNGDIDLSGTIDADDYFLVDRAFVASNAPPVSNVPPVAGDDLVFTGQETAVTFDPLTNDTDSDGTVDPKTVSLIDSPSHGQAIVDPVTGVITYTPAVGFSGDDLFHYTVKDNKGALSNPAAVKITVTAFNSLLGDMNGDGVLNSADLDAFDEAIDVPPLYALDFPNINPNIVGDINGDGKFDRVIDEPLLLQLISAPYRPDRFEPNDSFAQAKDLGIVDTRIEKGLTIHLAGNDDYYKFTEAKSGPANIEIRFDSTAGDVDLSVYDANKTLQASGQVTPRGKQVLIPLTQNDTYYIKVAGHNGSVSPSYDLIVADAVAPQIVSIDPPDGSLLTQTIQTLKIQFSEPLDSSTITAQNFQLLNTSTNALVTATVSSTNSGRDVELLFAPLVGGNYQLTIQAGSVTDLTGTPLGNAAVIRTFRIVSASVFWKNPNSGFWNDANNWSTHQVPGPTDDVLIDMPGNPVITFNSGSTEIHSLLSHNDFSLLGGTLQVDDFIQVDGQFALGGSATLSKAHIRHSPVGPYIRLFDSQYATLDGVTLNQPLYVYNQSVLTIINGLELNDVLTVQNARGDTGFSPFPDTQLIFDGTQSLSGTGRVELNIQSGTYSKTRLVRTPSTTLTIDTNMTLGGFAFNMDDKQPLINKGTLSIKNAVIRSSTFTNLGTVITESTATSKGYIEIDSDNLINSGRLEATDGTITIEGAKMTSSGVIQASNRGTVNIGTSNWSSSGLIRSTAGSTINLQNTYRLAGNRFEGRDGNIFLGGILDNRNTALVLDDASGPVQFAGVNIFKGQIVTSGGAAVEITNTGATLDGVTLNGDAIVNGPVLVRNNIALNGTMNLQGSLRFSGNGVLSGSGKIVLSDTYQRSVIAPDTNSGTSLRIGPGITIEGKYGKIGDSTKPLTNEGIIRAIDSAHQYTEVFVSGNSFNNTGTLEIDSLGYLTLQETAQTVSSGSMIANNQGIIALANVVRLTGNSPLKTAGGSISFGCVLENTGQTFTFTGSMTFLDGIIKGGTIGQLNVDNGRVFLDGVTVAGDLTITHGAKVQFSNGLTLDGTIHLAGTGAYLISNGDQTIETDSSGTIALEGAFNSISIGGNGSLTVDQGVRIRGGNGTITNTSNNNTAKAVLVNKGLIAADVLGQSITIAISTPIGLDNQGTLEATGGAILTIPTSVWTSDGTIRETNSTVNLLGNFSFGIHHQFAGTGGAINFGGDLNNIGSTLSLNNSTVSFVLAGGYIGGGVIDIASGQYLHVNYNDRNRLDSVTVNGDLDFSDDLARTVVSHSLVLNGTAYLRGYATALTIDSTTTITTSTHGIIAFEGTDGHAGIAFINPGATLTLDPGITVRGGSRSITFSRENCTLINKGVISADVAGATLSVTSEVNVANVINTGVMEAKNGAILSVANLSVNTGTVSALAGSSLVFDGESMLEGAIQVAGPGASLTIRGDAKLSSNQSFSLPAGAIFDVRGNLDLAAHQLTVDSSKGKFTSSFGGTIRGGTIAGPSGASLRFLYAGGNFGGILDQITLNIDTELEANAMAGFENGLTLNRSLTISNGAVLYSLNSQVLDGVGTVTLAAGGILTSWVQSELVLGSGITVHGSGNIKAQGSLINRGVISADIYSGYIAIFARKLTNIGTMQAYGGVLLAGTETGDAVNTGTIIARGSLVRLDGTYGNWILGGSIQAVGGGSVINLRGTVVLPADGSPFVISGGGQISNEGLLDLSGHTLALDTSGGTFIIFPSTGTIKNGRVSGTTGSLLRVIQGNNSATFDGVTLDIDSVIESGVSVYFRNNLMVNRTLTLLGDSYLTSLSSQSLGGQGNVVFSGQSQERIVEDQPHQLTILAGLTIHGGNGLITVGTLINEGTILADLSGTSISISAGQITNTGSMSFQHGAVLNLQGSLLVNGGSVVVYGYAPGFDVVANNDGRISFYLSENLKSLTLNDISKLSLPAGRGELLNPGKLNISPGAILDLSDNDLVLQSTFANRSSDLATLTGLIRSGRNGGDWAGAGLTSSAAAAEPNKLTGLAVALNDKGGGTPLYATFDGQPVDTNSILVKYTYNGDADLSGKIDADDYFQIDNGFATKSTGYRNGDLDFNGVVDADDYFLIDRAFAGQTGVLATHSPATSVGNGHSKVAAHRRARHHRPAHG